MLLELRDDALPELLELRSDHADEEGEGSSERVRAVSLRERTTVSP